MAKHCVTYLHIFSDTTDLAKLPSRDEEGTNDSPSHDQELQSPKSEGAIKLLRNELITNLNAHAKKY